MNRQLEESLLQDFKKYPWTAKSMTYKHESKTLSIALNKYRNEDINKSTCVYKKSYKEFKRGLWKKG